jgi:hypothetical protein
MFSKEPQAFPIMQPCAALGVWPAGMQVEWAERTRTDGQQVNEPLINPNLLRKG